MRLSGEAIKKFKEIYFEDYGVLLTDQEAVGLALNFIGLMRAIYKSMPKCLSYEKKLSQNQKSFYN